MCTCKQEPDYTFIPIQMIWDAKALTLNFSTLPLSIATCNQLHASGHGLHLHVIKILIIASCTVTTSICTGTVMYVQIQHGAYILYIKDLHKLSSY